MNLNLLTALDALLSEESVSAAARRVHVSTPAMSHSLARIREVTGDDILVRAGRRFVLTARAREMKPQIRRLIDEAASLLGPEKTGEISHIERKFVIRASEGLPIIFGADFFAAFHAVMPRAQLQFVSALDNRSSDLQEGYVDLEIGSATGKYGSQIETEFLVDQKLSGAVRQGHPLLMAPLSARRFTEYSHVCISDCHQPYDPIEAALAEGGYRRFAALTVPNPFAALAVAARSDLVATAPQSFANIMKERLQLAVFELPFSLPPERIVQAWHSRFTSDPAHRWLRSYVRNLLLGTDWSLSWPEA